MTKFRPCIDLHSGQVKQIVGGTLSDVAGDLKTNYVSKLPASHYAGLYQKHNLRGGHVVKLGPGNDDAAKESLSTWKGGLQVAGSITDQNAQYWIDQGAEKVSSPRIATIYGTIELPMSDHVHFTMAIGDYHILPLSVWQILARTAPIRPCSTRW